MPPPPPEPAGGTEGWQRLHPLSPVAQVGRMVPALVVIIVFSVTRKESSTTVVSYAFVFGGLAVFGVIHWLVTRWRIEGDTLHIETGLIRRDSRRLPVARIQSVDLVRPFAARLLGVSELRIRLAGSGSTDGRLAYLSQAEAASLRLRLLSGHHAPGTTSAQPADEPAREVTMARVGTGRLVASSLLSLVSLVLMGTLLTLGLLAAFVPKAAATAFGILAVYLFSFAGVVWRRIAGQYHFEAMEALDGVHIRRGLFQTISETIPYGRIQAVRQVQPLLWRPFGWCRLEVDIAGASTRSQRGEGTGVVRKALLPVGTRPDAWDLVVRLMEGPDPARTPPPPRARWKAPLSFHFLSAGYTPTHAVCVTGRLNRTTAWVPLEKSQSIRRIQGPVQRRLGLATVHVDVAGRRTRAEFRDRDVAEADGLVEQLSAFSRQARLAASAPRPDRSAPPPALLPPPSAPAGWFPDPGGRHEWRFWDGIGWTDQVGDAGQLTTEIP
jgi:putative membrane protein